MTFSAMRSGAGLTLNEVAKQFHVSVETVDSWETGRRQPPAKVCRFFDNLRLHNPEVRNIINSERKEFEIKGGIIRKDINELYPNRQKQTGRSVMSRDIIKSKKRVSDHGEVFTPPWLVEDMLKLVQYETERIDSRFLEPACGSGNFLVPILKRKLVAVNAKYGKSAFEKRHYAFLALTSLYGIELLSDNITECRAKMLEVFTDYLCIDEKDELYRAAIFVLSLNLIQGDAMKMVAADGQPIRFTEWSSVGKGKFKRRDFRLDSLTRAGKLMQSGVQNQESLFAGLGRHEVFTPVRDYAPLTVLELAAANRTTKADERTG